MEGLKFPYDKSLQSLENLIKSKIALNICWNRKFAIFKFSTGKNVVFELVLGNIVILNSSIEKVAIKYKILA